MTNAQAITTFLKAFAYTRSFTRGAELVRVGSMQIVRDVDRSRDDVRAEELFFLHNDARKSIDDVKAYANHTGYRLCVFHPSDVSIESIRAQYRPLGYRPNCVEWLFVRDLAELPAASDVLIQRVKSQEDANKIRQLSGRWMIRPEDWEDPRQRIRIYFIEQKGKAVSYVRVAHLEKRATYAAGLFTMPEHRRKGYATALMNRMMRDDAAAGVKHAVLMASTDGAKLYPHLGYRERLVMQIFTPVRKKS